jgi:hypothetical protein
MSMVNIYDRTIYVEIPLSPALYEQGAKFNFPFVPELRKNPCRGLAVYSGEIILNNSPERSNLSLSVLSAADLSSFYLNLSDQESFAFVQNTPISFFNTVLNRQFFRTFDRDRYLDLESSFLVLSAQLEIDETQTIIFAFKYSC